MVAIIYAGEIEYGTKADIFEMPGISTPLACFGYSKTLTRMFK